LGKHLVEKLAPKAIALLALHHIEVQDTEGIDLNQALGNVARYEEPFMAYLEKAEHGTAVAQQVHIAIAECCQAA
jgi:hypothetical protein